VINANEPILLALLASAFYGLALVITQFGLRHVAAADGALISVPTTTLLFWVLSPFVFDVHGWQPSAAMIFALVGLFFPAAVTVLTFEANRRLGPTIAGAMGSTTPLFAAAMAVLFLGERVTLLTLAATLVVVAGGVVLVWQQKSGPDRRLAWLLLLPLIAAMLRAAAQAIIKVGLAAWPSAFAASLIGYSISVVALFADARFRRGVGNPHFDVNGAIWFALVGLCNGAAVFLTYAALARDAVTLVAPTVATYPLFALVFGAALLPQQRITPRLIIGTMLTVAGIIGLLLGR
jgi:drug/metabolite transporter (DMT)-like permease